jgi:hypothetical protein
MGRCTLHLNITDDNAESRGGLRPLGRHPQSVHCTAAVRFSEGGINHAVPTPSRTAEVVEKHQLALDAGTSLLNVVRYPIELQLHTCPSTIMQ